ncbi:hypothetical protein C0081_12820 [Cohaesibacter celericrescens]|uniref:Uncharacterized protein n=1 Tax=Cohaesibacter celericrescens TaxID=2067669 RepID=A0A2N5XQX8_9HYPH|nr:hypothetical protein C0081_12820 [Cohaesibacter celericrescens]
MLEPKPLFEVFYPADTPLTGDIKTISLHFGAGNRTFEQHTHNSRAATQNHNCLKDRSVIMQGQNGFTLLQYVTILFDLGLRGRGAHDAQAKFDKGRKTQINRPAQSMVKRISIVILRVLLLSFPADQRWSVRKWSN